MKFILVEINCISNLNISEKRIREWQRVSYLKDSCCRSGVINPNDWKMIGVISKRPVYFKIFD